MNYKLTALVKKVTLAVSMSLSVCFLTCFLSPGLYAEDKILNGTPPFSTVQNFLDNGLNILITEMPQSGLVSIYALVKAGSATEGKYLGSGITHFIEHMVFKGTETRSVGAIAQEIEALGGTINASTSFDYTIFTVTVPKTEFEKGLDILSDLLMHPRFDPQELEKEQQVVAKEIRLHTDNPSYYIQELVLDTVYKTHPYKIPIIGFEEVFLRLKREDVLDYYAKTYIPNNIILSIAGGVRGDEILPIIRGKLEGFARRNQVIRNLPQEPEQLSARQRTVEYPTDLTRMSLSFPGVNITSPDMFALDVLAMTLGQGESSRLYEDLFKRKGLVQSVSASNDTPFDMGFFEIDCVLPLENIDAAINNIYRHIQAIQSQGITAFEHKKAQQQVLSQSVYDYQRTSDIAVNNALYEAFLGDYNFYQKYIQAIQHVSSDDIKRVARKYLNQNRSSLVILKPKQVKAEPLKSETKNPVSYEVKKITLANGLTLLLKEDHQFPLIAICLAAHAGVKTESIEKNGLSLLTSQTWTRGTKTMTAEKIAREIESRGAGLSTFSDYDTIGLSLNCLSGDWDFALNLLVDIVINPVFDPTELEKEREIIKTAIVARKDNIFKQTSMALQELIFPSYYFGRMEEGTLESISRITRQDVTDYYNKHLLANNMVVSVYGDFDSTKVAQILEAKFSKLKKGSLDISLPSLAALGSSPEVVLETDKRQALVMIGFRAVGLTDPDRYGLELLTAILGSSFQGRIFNKIREEFGQSYALGGSFFPILDHGMIIFYVATTNEYIPKIRDMLFEILDDIRKNPITDTELNDTKSYLKGRHQRSLETMAALASRATVDTLYGFGYDYYKKYNERIDQVTPADILNLSNKYLNKDQYSVILTHTRKPVGLPNGILN